MFHPKVKMIFKVFFIETFSNKGLLTIPCFYIWCLALSESTKCVNLTRNWIGHIQTFLTSATMYIIKLGWNHPTFSHIDYLLINCPAFHVIWTKKYTFSQIICQILLFFQILPDFQNLPQDPGSRDPNVLLTLIMHNVPTSIPTLEVRFSWFWL